MFLQGRHTGSGNDNEKYSRFQLLRQIVSRAAVQANSEEGARERGGRGAEQHHDDERRAES